MRETERARARRRAAARPPRRDAAPRLHPDQDAAAAERADALGAALGADVRVRAHGTGYRVELDLETSTRRSRCAAARSRAAERRLTRAAAAALESPPQGD